MSGENVLFFDPQKCIGCRLCEIWCSIEHFGVINPRKSNIRIIRDHEKQIDLANYCHQCTDYPCVEACNFDALSQDEKDASVNIEMENCVGCGLCVEACPHDEAILRPDEKKIMICDLCGGDPVCVDHCPEQAIIFVGRDQAMEKQKDLIYKHEPKLLKTEDAE